MFRKTCSWFVSSRNWPRPQSHVVRVACGVTVPIPMLPRYSKRPELPMSVAPTDAAPILTAGLGLDGAMLSKCCILFCETLQGWGDYDGRRGRRQTNRRSTRH